MNRRLGYFVAGALAFVLCGWIPGPQGSVSPGSDATLGSLDLSAGAASAPSLTFGDSDTGIWAAGGNILSFSLNNAERLRVNASRTATTTELAFGTVVDTPDLALARDGAAGVLKVYDPSGSADAEIRVYDDTNNGYFALKASGSLAQLTADPTQFSAIQLVAGGAARVTVSGSLFTHLTQTAWSTGLGAITHLLGPSDQSFTLQPGSGQTLVLNDEGGDAALTVQTDGIVVGAGTVRGAALQTSSFSFTASSSTVSLIDGIELQIGSAAADAQLSWNTTQTQDHLQLAFGGDGGNMALVLADDGNNAADLGLSDYTDPTLVLTSATAWSGDTTEWASLSVATGGNLEIATGNLAHSVFFTYGANTRIGLLNSGVQLGSSTTLQWQNSAAASGGNGDTIFSRDAESVVALKGDGDADAAIRVYDSDESDYARFAASGANVLIGINATTCQTLSSSANTFNVNTRVADDIRHSYGTGFDVFEQGEMTTLTDGSATTVFSVVTGDGDMGGVVIHYTIQSTDGTEYQSESGTVHIAVVDDAGGVVADVNESSNTAQAVSSGTLTSTWSIVTTDDQSLEVQVNADTSLTPSTHQIRWKATCSGDVTLTVP